MHSAETIIYSGTSGLVVPVPQSLYPPEFQGKSRLEYYASLLNSLEVNSSFYKFPKVSTIKKWVEMVPGNFQFTFKLPKTISHSKAFAFNEKDIDDFMKLVSAIGDKKGCLLAQFPPGLKVDKLPEFRDFLKAMIQNNGDDWKVAVEFRNPSWYCNDVYELLAKNNISLVIHDLPNSTPPLTVTANFVYLRFHGPGGRYRGSYSDDFLSGWASNIKEWLAEGKVVYCYFNNTMGDAYKNLQTLNEFVRKG